jgi:hypothetical protein
MKTKFMAGMLVAVAAAGITSSAFADTRVEQKTVTSEGCGPTSFSRTTTETTATPVVAAPIVEERMTTIQRPVMIETAPMVEKKIIRTNGHETIKMKEYY